MLVIIIRRKGGYIISYKTAHLMSNIQHCVSVSVAAAARSSPLLPSIEKAYGWDLKWRKKIQIRWRGFICSVKRCKTPDFL